MSNLGYIFRIKDPNDPNKWIDVPVLYQTMYQAYKAYCESIGLSDAQILDEKTYYTALGSLKNLSDALTGTGALTTLSGGTGIAASNLSDLLNQLGLTGDVSKVGDTLFPTNAAVRAYVTNQLNAASAIINTKISEQDAQLKLKLDITYGTEDPGDNTPGDVYIKY